MRTNRPLGTSNDSTQPPLGLLAAQVRRMAEQTAVDTCSDLHVIVSGMLQAEGAAQMRDGAAVSELVRGQRRLDWLQAYRREVLDGPGSEVPLMRPGKGGRCRGAAGRGRGGPSSQCEL